MRFFVCTALVAAGCSFELAPIPVGENDFAVVVPTDMAMARDMAKAPDLRTPLDLATPIGHLLGSVATPGATVDLTAEGTTDWVHWGLGGAGFDRKNGAVTSFVNNYTLVGSGVVVAFSTSAVGYTWTDGTPTASAAATTTAIYISGSGNGFSISAPADLTMRTLHVYVSSYQADLALSAHLSDSSAGDFNDSFTNTGLNSNIYKRYTFVYNAAHIGQTLTVSWTDTADHHGGGNVTLQAATLQ